MISSVIIENDSVVKNFQLRKNEVRKHQLFLKDKKGEVPEKPELTEYRTRRRMEDDYESGIRKIIKML